jgi:phosphoribosylglycinamide formyltransferase-1
MTKLAVFVSGTGTNLQAILASGLAVSLVVADRPCPGLTIARSAGVPTHLAHRTSFGPDFNRERYTDAVLQVVVSAGIDVIALAGFMTIFSPALCEHYAGRILNTHPSLLPAFKGARPVEDALTYGVKLTGCTVHSVTSDLDGGPILAQAAVPVLAGDTIESLHERIKKVERVIYPETIRQLIEKASRP